MRERRQLIRDPRISYELTWCLTARFQTVYAINDYEEVIDIADNIVATHSPGDSPTTIQRGAIHLIKVLVMSRQRREGRILREISEGAPVRCEEATEE